MEKFKLTTGQIAAYHEDGYIIVKNFLTSEEIKKLYDIATGDDTMKNNAFDLNDLPGKKTKLALWYTPGNDACGLLTKSERMVHSVNQLMEEATPVCHFHSKLMQKEPGVGGAWEWKHALQ